MGSGQLPPPTCLTSIALTSSGTSAHQVAYTSTSTDWSANPSISSLLATPISSIPSMAKHPAVVLSPALPPVPARRVEKIKTGDFVDMKELLGDNIALLRRMDEVRGQMGISQTSISATTKLRDIPSPVAWIACFLIYAAVGCRDEHTKAFLVYARIILDLARKHQGKGWLDYDRVFRQQMAADPTFLKWAEVNPSLLSTTVISQGAGGMASTLCSLCYETDHTTTECALQALERQSKLTSPSDRRSDTPPQNRAEICRNFNRGRCTKPTNCKYRHACQRCAGTDHISLVCPKTEKGTSSTTPPAKKTRVDM